MAQVIEGGEFGVVFEGAELGDLLKLVEFAIVTTENVGVPVWELGEWKTALEEALTKPREEEEEIAEEKPPTGSQELCANCESTFSSHTYAGAENGSSRWKCPSQMTMFRGKEFRFEIILPKEDNSAKAPVRGKRVEIEICPNKHCSCELTGIGE